MVRLWEVESVAYPMLVLTLSVRYMLSFSYCTALPIPPTWGSLNSEPDSGATGV